MIASPAKKSLSNENNSRPAPGVIAVMETNNLIASPAKKSSSNENKGSLDLSEKPRSVYVNVNQSDVTKSDATKSDANKTEDAKPSKEYKKSNLNSVSLVPF